MVEATNKIKEELLCDSCGAREYDTGVHGLCEDGVYSMQLCSECFNIEFKKGNKNVRQEAKKLRDSAAS